MLFEWDEAKRLSNLTKHGLDLSVVGPQCEPGGQRLATHDQRKSYGEDRFMGFGRLTTGKVVAACFSLRGQVVRIISLRKANQRETEKYEQAIKSHWQPPG